MPTKNGDFVVSDLAAQCVRGPNDIRVGGDADGQAIGFACVALLPAAFWTLLCYGVAALLGTELSATVLTIIFSAVTLFLGVIFAAVVRADIDD